mmetsp:Transcript_7696/g.21748  ORF Transcript_7696/g.21748 Transcript_7696/m.21748 type:complete len:276 (+) Transcript_7696:1541-2368(+)
MNLGDHQLLEAVLTFCVVRALWSSFDASRMSHSTRRVGILSIPLASSSRVRSRDATSVNLASSVSRWEFSIASTLPPMFTRTCLIASSSPMQRSSTSPRMDLRRASKSATRRCPSSRWRAPREVSELVVLEVSARSASTSELSAERASVSLPAAAAASATPPRSSALRAASSVFGAAAWATLSAPSSRACTSARLELMRSSSACSFPSRCCCMRSSCSSTSDCAKSLLSTTAPSFASLARLSHFSRSSSMWAVVTSNGCVLDPMVQDLELLRAMH